MLYDHDIDKSEIKEIQALIDPIRIETSLEGQKVENGTIFIGSRAGPSSNLDNILHELAHFIEIDEKRMDQHGWGLKYGKWVDSPFPNRYCSGWYELTTDKHIQREIRVWAYQANLLKYFKLPVDFQDLAEIAPYLPDLWLYKNGKTDKERVANIARQIEDLAGQISYSFESIWNEVRRKTAILKLKVLDKTKNPI